MFLAVACALMLHGPLALPASGAPPVSIGTPGAVGTAPWPGQAPDLLPPMRTGAVVVVSLLLLAVAGWLWRRTQVKGGGSGVERIDLLASRSFGPRHRVAVIETCGERLLLALCDKEISVLSHLPCAEANPAAAAGAQVVNERNDTEAPAERRFEVVP